MTENQYSVSVAVHFILGVLVKHSFDYDAVSFKQNDGAFLFVYSIKFVLHMPIVFLKLLKGVRKRKQKYTNFVWK